MDNGSDEHQVDLWDEYAREEVERNYQQLMREHLELKKSYTLLQAQTSCSLDPEREAKLCRALESDLFEAQCKIEELKALLQSSGLEPRLLEEKETLQSANIQMQKELKLMEDKEDKLREELLEAKEQIEDLEFRILELEESQNTSLEDGNDTFGDLLRPLGEQSDYCNEEKSKISGVRRTLFNEDNRNDLEIADAAYNSDMNSEDEQLLREEVNCLRKQIIELTERPALDFPLKTMEKKPEKELSETDRQKQLHESQQRIEELEYIAFELQGKIIGLQQDKMCLEEQLLHTTFKKHKNNKDKESEDQGQSLSQEISTENAVGVDESLTLDNVNDEDHVFRANISEIIEACEAEKICTDSTLGCEDGVVPEVLQSELEIGDKDLFERDLNESLNQNKVVEEIVLQKEHSILEVCSEKVTTMDDGSVVGINVESKNKNAEDSWKEIESAIISETIAELAAENGNENMTNAEMKEASLDLIDYPDNNSLLEDVEDENMELLQQQSECLESIKQILSEQGILSHVELMLREMEEIKEENAALREKLATGNTTLASGEIVNAELTLEKLHQLEEHCENLRNKVHSTEQSEILLRTKLKHAEDTVTELESSESLLKVQLEKISQREAEWKKKAQGLLRSVSELEQLLKEKDLIEEKLHEKIQALEEADMRNARKLAELQEDESLLRESLRSRDDISDKAKMSDKLKKKVKELEKNNQLLKTKISELEESEAILREHWKQIVDADANKMECLQEKIKMLEALNKELQSRLQDKEEEFATGVSLASELSFSQNPSDSEESAISFDMETKFKNLEEKLQNVTEAKNSRIEKLEDCLERLQENEQKLSETVMEMEQRERELLAKLKLCENSDFTVEKMLSYEDRIKELSNSQDYLLNAIDTMVDPESQSQQIINDLKEELVSSCRKSDEISFKERVMNEQLRNENNSLKNQLDKSTENERELLDQISSLEKEKDALNVKHSSTSQNSKQEVTTSSLFVRIQELETENLELSGRNNDSQNQPRVKSAAATVSLNYERLCELENENSELLAEVNKLRDIEIQSRDTAEKLRLLETNEGRLMEKVMELEDSCESLKEELQKAQKDKSENTKTITATLETNQKQLKEEQEKVASLLKLEAEARDRLLAEEELNSALREQLKSFRLRLEEIKNTYADHENSKMELEKKLEEVSRDKALLVEKLQSISQNKIIPVNSKLVEEPMTKDNLGDHTAAEHSSEPSLEHPHLPSTTDNTSLPSTEDKYLVIMNSLEASLKDIGSSNGYEQYLSNEKGQIVSGPVEKKSACKLSKMSREELIEFSRILQSEIISKCQKIQDFENQFAAFSKGIRCSTVIFRDKEVRKTVQTETRTFHKRCNCQVPTDGRTTPAGEKTSRGVNTEDVSTETITNSLTEQQCDASNRTTTHVKMPRSEYEAWHAKVAILTNIEANLPDVMESTSQLELLLQILQKGRDVLCSEDQAGVSNEELLYYARLFQTLSKGLNSTPAPLGTGAKAGKEVQNEEEQCGVQEEVIVPSSKTPRLLDTSSKSERKRLIKKLISHLPSEDLAVVAKTLKQNVTKEKDRKEANMPHTSVNNGQKELEEIEVDMWLSSEDEDEHQNGKVHETGQPDTDSTLPAAVVADGSNPEEIKDIKIDDEWKPPLPKTPPPESPPALSEEPLVVFAKDIDEHVAKPKPVLSKTPISQQLQSAEANDQSKQQESQLANALNDRNKYISTLEASIEKLGQLLTQQQGSSHIGVREEAIKKLEEQLRNMQQELRQHHKEGQQSLTSLRTELQNKNDIANNAAPIVQSFPQPIVPKPATLSHSYSTTDLSKMASSSTELDTPVKISHSMRSWPSRSHLAPSTFARTVRRRSDTFEPKHHGSYGNVNVSPMFSGWSAIDKTGQQQQKQQQQQQQKLPGTYIFVAASDYDPELFSASGRPHLEIPLKEGDIVITKGPVSGNGYCEAKVNGKVGLVPAKYLHPVNPETMTTDERRSFRLQFPGESTESSPEHIIRPLGEVGPYFHQSHLTSIPKLPSGHPSNYPERSWWNKSVSMPRLPGPSTSPTSSLYGGAQFVKRHSGGHISHSHAKGLPEAPSNFRLERLVGENSVLLSWQPPLMDELDQNNGMQLIGYRIFLNGRLCQQPGSAHLAKAVVENLNLSRPQYFAIQSVAASGQMSPPAEVVFEGMDRWSDPAGTSDIESDTDLSDILPSHHVHLGPQKTFVAIYDYNPSMQSPHDYAECEIRFRAGDLIIVYGNQRSDGFYWGELNGNQGLVPASFIEEVPLQGTRSKPVSRRGSTTSQNSLLQGVGRPST